MQWFYAREGKQHGPVSIDDLREMAAQGRLRPNDLVWNVEFGSEWREAGTVAEIVFSPGLPAGTPAASPPVPVPVFSTRNVGPVPANREIMQKAREALQTRWGLAGGIYFVLWFLTLCASIIPGAGYILQIVVSAPLSLGFAMVCLAFARLAETSISMLFKGFESFGRAFVAQLLMGLFVMLWALLLVIPGIVAALSYQMTFFILADNPAVSASEAISQSKKMMQGHKMRLFALYLRFIGWFFLCMFTLGIGLIWLIPYVQVSTAFFYEDLRARS